ncbi:DUF1853 family protein [Maribacter algarum]|uniref:DUF1853 family protein n=1 Tax=Maribacter algarum (ex Zhang et al. 2020) TaxID=2578118 RepID=A0A5S3PRQ2_9FLAO|nr:DUF1853 family protein [Maribacter algarum]TMM57392.1 DUF1853 family protein [Maribacter algarum]
MSQTHLQKQCAGFLNTPPLWQKEQFGIKQFEFPKIDWSTFQPKAISERIRLGHQMEHVFKQLVEHSEAYEILLHNLPIKDGNRTIGEIDFVLKNTQTRQLIHVELTYKFYIINPEISEPIHQLMGPNRRDMFFTKMEKIKNDQFQLLHSHEGSKALHNKDIDHTKILHQACYKAQLFDPYRSNPVNIRPLNTECFTGYWLRFEDFKTADFKSFEFYIPFKAQWVIEPHEDVQWTSHFETLMDINLRMLKENTPMVWMKTSETEFEKFFVVWW